MAITVEIAGVDRTALIERGTAVSWSKGVNGQGVARFRIGDLASGFVPDEGQAVEILEDGTARFGGIIVGRPRRIPGRHASDPFTYYEISAASYEQRLLKRRVDRAYVDTAFEDIVDDINTTFLGSEGFTLDVTAGSVLSYTFNGETVAEAIDILCDLETDGRTWRVDPDVTLIIEVPSETATPHILDASIVLGNSDGAPSNPHVEPVRAGYFNTFTIVGGGPDLPITYTARDTTEISARAAAEGGSGIYHGWEERSDLKTEAAVQAAAEGKVDRHKVVQQRVKMWTDYPGFEAGQEGEVDLPELDLDETTMYVESVMTRTDPSGTGGFIHEITAITGKPRGSVASYYRAQKRKPRTIAHQVEAAPGLTRVEPELGPLVHDPVREPLEWYQGDASGTLDETPSAIALTHRRISGVGSGNHIVSVRRDAAETESVLELFTIDANEKPATTPSRELRWSEFAANANFKSPFCVDPTSTYAAVVQYGSPGTLVIVNINGGGLVGSVACNLSAQANGGGPIWTSDGYIYWPNISDGKVYIYDVTDPSSPSESGSFTTSLTAAFHVVASSDEAWLYVAGTDGFVSLDRSNPTSLSEDTVLAAGDYVSCAIDADDSLIGAAVRADASNVQVAMVAVSDGTITMTFEDNVALATGAMEGYGAILDDDSLIVFSARNPTGANSLEAHVFNVATPAAPTFTETLTYTHGASGNVGPAISAAGRKAAFTFFFNTDAQITYGQVAFDEIEPYQISAPTLGAPAPTPPPPRMGFTGIVEGQRGNLEAWTGRQTRAVIPPPQRDQDVLMADFTQTALSGWESNDLRRVVEIDDTDSPYDVVDGDDVIICDTSSGAITINLPALASSTHRRLEVRNAGSAGNDVTIDPASTEQIDGASTFDVEDDATATISASSSQWEVTSLSSPAGVATDHGSLPGLNDDDHTQYALLAGRAGGQTIIGGTAAGEDLTLQSTSNATRGDIIAADDMHLLGGAVVDGALLIGDTTNADMTIGLTINQGANDNQAAALKSSDIAHGMTSLAETDTYLALRKWSATAGGVWIQGFTETTVAYGMTAEVTSGNTGKSTSAQAAFEFWARKKSGTTVGAMGANDNIAGFRDNSSTRLLIDAEGDIHYDGTTNAGAWDTHDDVALLSGFRAMTMGDGHYRQQLVHFVEYARPVLERTGVVRFNEDGHHFVSTKGLNGLMIDAIRQVNNRARGVVDRVAELEQQLEDAHQRLALLETKRGGWWPSFS